MNIWKQIYKKEKSMDDRLRSKQNFACYIDLKRKKYQYFS